MARKVETRELVGGVPEIASVEFNHESPALNFTKIRSSHTTVLSYIHIRIRGLTHTAIDVDQKRRWTCMTKLVVQLLHH